MTTAPGLPLPFEGIEYGDATAAHAAARLAVSNAAPAETPDTTSIPQWPEALALPALNGLAGDIVRTISPTTESSEAALLIQLLAAFGSTIGRGPHFKVEETRHGTNLFAVMVGRSSKARKGTAWNRIRALCAAVDQAWTDMRVVHGLSSGEGLIQAVRDPKGADAGELDKRLFVIEEEFAGTLRVMGREGNTLSPRIREAWDHGQLRTMTKNTPIQATGAHVSIIGHVTAPELQRHLTETEAGNGFANRFLWVAVARSKCLPEGGSVPAADQARLVTALRRAVEFARACEELKRDTAARALWAAVYPELSEAAPGLFGAVTGRAEAQVTRLACIYALLDSSAIIRPEHIQAALAVWDYCEQSARFIFGAAMGDPVADTILRELRAEIDGLSRTEIRAIFAGHRSSIELGRALTALAEASLATVEMRNTGGRPEEIWRAARGAQKAQ